MPWRLSIRSACSTYSFVLHNLQSRTGFIMWAFVLFVFSQLVLVYFGLNVMSMCCCLTAKDKGEKKLFGYSFVPLMQEDGRTLPDGTHELIIHKVIPCIPSLPRFWLNNIEWNWLCALQGVCFWHTYSAWYSFWCVFPAKIEPYFDFDNYAFMQLCIFTYFKRFLS